MEKSSVYDFQVKNILGQNVSMGDYKSKVVLIVNTASKCGYTKQYAGLEKLYQKYKEQGFFVLGFPCNQFGGQEPGDSSEILNFCSLNYGVSFPMFEKINVNGKNTDPLFSYLKKEAKGVLGTEAVKWNFTKFLVDKEGHVVQRFAPADQPEDLASAIESLFL